MRRNTSRTQRLLENSNTFFWQTNPPTFKSAWRVSSTSRGTLLCCPEGAFQSSNPPRHDATTRNSFESCVIDMAHRKYPLRFQCRHRNRSGCLGLARQVIVSPTNERSAQDCFGTTHSSLLFFHCVRHITGKRVWNLNETEMRYAHWLLREDPTFSI